jgi:hypothetical protein
VSGNPHRVAQRAADLTRGQLSTPSARLQIEAEPPVRSVEETVGAGGRRRMRGTYLLEALEPATTIVRFSVAPIELPQGERPLWPLSRAWLRRQNRARWIACGSSSRRSPPARRRRATSARR